MGGAHPRAGARLLRDRGSRSDRAQPRRPDAAKRAGPDHDRGSACSPPAPPKAFGHRLSAPSNGGRSLGSRCMAAMGMWKRPGAAPAFLFCFTFFFCYGANRRHAPIYEATPTASRRSTLHGGRAGCRSPAGDGPTCLHRRSSGARSADGRIAAKRIGLRLNRPAARRKAVGELRSRDALAARARPQDKRGARGRHSLTFQEGYEHKKEGAGDYDEREEASGGDRPGEERNWDPPPPGTKARKSIRTGRRIAV